MADSPIPHKKMKIHIVTFQSPLTGMMIYGDPIWTSTGEILSLALSFPSHLSVGRGPQFSILIVCWVNITTKGQCYKCYLMGKSKLKTHHRLVSLFHRFVDIKDINTTHHQKIIEIEQLTYSNHSV